MKVYIVLYDGFDPEYLKFLNYLKPHSELETIYVATEIRKFSGIDIDVHANDITKEERGFIHTLLIPGGKPIGETAELIAVLEKMGDIADDILLLGNASTLFAHTGLLNDCDVAVQELELPALKAEFPDVKWVARSLLHSCKIWSIASLELAKALGTIYSVFLKKPFYGYYPRPLVTREEWHKSDPDYDPDKKVEPGKVIAQEISTCKNSSNVVYSAVPFAARLATEGFLEQANIILTTMFSTFPDCVDDIYRPTRTSFEFLWEKYGARPEGVLWEKGKPSEQELEEKYKEIQKEEDYPSNTEEKAETLETAAVMIGVGDTDLHPFSFAMVISLALEMAQEDRAREWMKQFAYVLSTSYCADWNSAIKYRPLAGFILDGIVGREAGRTISDAQQDADRVAEALRLWPAAHEIWVAERNAQRAKIALLSYDEIISRFEPFNYKELTSSVRKPPASEEEITAAEERLGIKLPEEYKDFLRVSNGMNFLVGLSIPGLRPVEQLEWQGAQELGFEELTADLGIKFTLDEHDQVPRMGRVLMISDPDDEEQIWLLEPAQVQNVLDLVKKGRKQDEYIQDVGWRVAFWLDWCPDIRWFKTFREYIDNVVVKIGNSELPSD